MLSELRIGPFKAERKAMEILAEELRAGRYRLHPAKKLDQMPLDTELYKLLRFKRYPNGLADVVDQICASDEAIEARMDAARRESQRLIDDLILGDSAEALAAVRAFEAKEF